jgi:hypothetical protein
VHAGQDFIDFVLVEGYVLDFYVAAPDADVQVVRVDAVYEGAEIC